MTCLHSIRRKEEEALGLCNLEHDRLDLELTPSRPHRFEIDAKHSRGLTGPLAWSVVRWTATLERQW